MKKAGTIIYAVGWTQHSSGTQTIRGAAILQLLLGNVGRAGGGVNALRGHSNIQGATDMAGIFDLLPGYLKVPTPADKDFKAYLERITPKSSKPGPWESFNYWSNTPKFAVSLLKAFYGDAATKENDWAFHYLPKVDRKYSWAEIWDDMYRGKVKGLLAFGMNGVSIGPNSHKNIAGAEEGGVAGGVRDLSGRDQRVLEISRHHERGDGEDSDDRVPSAWRGLSRRRTARSSTPRAGCSGRARRCRLRPAASSTRKSWRAFSSRLASCIKRKAASFPIRFCTPPGTTPIRTTRRSPKSRGKSTGGRSPMSPIPS